MKKLILGMVFVFATGTMMNANTNVEVDNSISEEIKPGWTCEEWSNFVFEWVGLDHSFEDAASAGQSAFDNCVD